jgi:hypothetical protein
VVLGGTELEQRKSVSEKSMPVMTAARTEAHKLKTETRGLDLPLDRGSLCHNEKWIRGGETSEHRTGQEPHGKNNLVPGELTLDRALQTGNEVENRSAELEPC